MAQTRRDLVVNVWPDKLLYASIMLLVTGAIGALYAGVVLAFGIKMNPKLPALLRLYPAWLTLLLSLASVVFAYMAMKKVRTLWGFLGAAAGIASLGLLGIGSVFALVAALFLVASVLEKEEERVRASNVGPEAWPDKSLAASLLLLVAGGVSAAWGVGVLTRAISFDRTWAYIELAAAVLCLAASWFLYHQRGMWIGVGAGVAAIVGGAGYVLAPLLGAVALWSIWQAHEEGEFELDAPVPPAAAPAPRA